MQNLTFIQILNTGLNILGAVGIAAGIWVYFRFRISNETIKLYQDNQAAQDKRIGILEGQLAEANLKITAMQTQIDIVKDLPLRDIANTLAELMKTQNTILSTQTSILNHLSLMPNASPVTINTPGVTAQTN